MGNGSITGRRLTFNSGAPGTLCAWTTIHRSHIQTQIRMAGVL